MGFKITKILARRGMKVRFTDATHGKGAKDARIVIHCDGSLLNVEGSKSQVGVVGMVCSRSQVYGDEPDMEYREPNLPRARAPIKQQRYIMASPVLWLSQKSPRVANSTYAAEAQAVFLAFDTGCVLRQIYGELLFGSPLSDVPVDVKNDNLGVVRAIHAIVAQPTEKRMAGVIRAMREILSKGEIRTCSHIPGTAHMADPLTKALPANNLFYLLTGDKCEAYDPAEQLRKKRRAAAGKQYLYQPRY